MSEKAKFPSQDELEQFQGMLEEIGLQKNYHELAIEFPSGGEEVRYRFYTDWREMFRGLEDGPWWTNQYDSLEELFAVILSEKVARKRIFKSKESDDTSEKELEPVEAVA